MSVYFYLPLNFTHCWVSLLTDCLWWCWRSTNTAEEAVHITLPHCSISPCRASTYLINRCGAHSHPSLHMCNLPPTWQCVCITHLSRCSCEHPHKTVCTLHLCVRDKKISEVRLILHALWRLLAPVSHVCSAFKSIRLYLFLLKSPRFLDFTQKVTIGDHFFPTEHRDKEKSYHHSLKSLISYK